MSSESEQTDQSPSRWSAFAGSVAMEPMFNLIYLVFLFLPWFFKGPERIDLIVAAFALLVFLPVHFYAFTAPTRQRIVPIAIVALIGVTCNFFMLGAGVFHIYCAAMAGFCRPVRLSGVIVAVCVVVYVVSALLAERGTGEMAFVLFMSFIVWFSTMSTAQTLLDRAQAERERELDTQQASLLERERIGRDLHDLLGHTLTMVALKSDLAGRLITDDPEQAKAELKDIQVGARRALNDVREALSGLAVVSVANELKNARKALASAGVELTIVGSVPEVSTEQDQAWGLMIREAVTNIIRHTKASAARIEFLSGEHDLGVAVIDNGGGKIEQEGRGLSGLRSRIEALGGSVAISDAGGVSLTATIPTASTAAL